MKQEEIARGDTTAVLLLFPSQVLA